MIPALVYAAPAWKDQLQRVRGPRRRIAVRHHGNVAFLPAPVAGYRIRHDGAESVVEIKCSRAPAIELARCRSVGDARHLLSILPHQRPFLGEIGRPAA